MTAVQRRLAAIMFSDIVGYSRMMGDDEAATLTLLREHNALLVPIIKTHGGSVLKFIGDAILASFESASQGVLCAVAIQKALAARNKDQKRKLLVRIGLHIGDVTEQDGDIFGDGVNIAARIQPLAEPGGICISQTVYHIVRAQPEIRVSSMGERELKNIKESVHIYSVQVSDEAAPKLLAASGRNSRLALSISALALLVAASAVWKLTHLRMPTQQVIVRQIERIVVTQPKSKARPIASVRSEDPFTLLDAHAQAWRHTRAKETAHALESWFASHREASWPLPLVRLYVRDLTEAKALSAASGPDQTCDAHYYVGMRSLLAPEGRESFFANKATISYARAFLEKAAAGCPTTNPRRAHARRELDALKNSTP